MTVFRKLRWRVPTSRGALLYYGAILCLFVIAGHLRNRAAETTSHNGEAVVETARKYREDLKQRIVTLKQEQRQTVRVPVKQDDTSVGEGIKRAEFLRNVCSSDTRFNQQLDDKSRVRVSHDATHNALFCPLCKMASTFWTRVFKMLLLNRLRTSNNLVKTPFHVPIAQAPASKQYLSLQTQRVDQHDAHDSFKFLFIRNPYAMLFSAFVDKVVGPNPTYWKTFGQPGIKLARQTSSRSCGSDITFAEFLQLIAHTDQSHQKLECHVAKYAECHPCATNYTYVGKMETFKADTFHILSKLGQNQTLEVFKDKFTELHANDAIDDSVSGAFNWKRDITRCISWPEALRRVWRKLQIRGAIGASKFPLTNEQALVISKDEFINLITEISKKVPSSQKSELKRLSFKEAYQSVPISVVNDIRKVYWQEFALFDYIEEPGEIFDRSNEFKYFGLLNYTNIADDIDIFTP